MVSQQGEPVEFFFTPGSASNVAHLDDFDFDLPPQATVYADKAYNHYLIEDCLAEDGQLTLSPFRKNNSKRPVPPWQRFCNITLVKLLNPRPVWWNPSCPNPSTPPMLLVSS